MPAQFESDACRPQSIGGVDRVAYISKRHDCTAPRKRLDVLCQELNREATTLGSKSVANEMTRISVELKVLIEQMREQVQNLE
jgi:uncharacterized protein (TIGR00255 family)